MPKAYTPKQQAKACAEILAGKTYEQVAKKYGASKSTIARWVDNGTKQLKERDGLSVRDREFNKEFVIATETVLAEIANLASADPRRVMSWGPGGVILRPSDELTAMDAKLVSEISMTTTKDGSTSMKIKLHNRIQPLDMLAKHLRIYATLGDEDSPLAIKFIEVDV